MYGGVNQAEEMPQMVSLSPFWQTALMVFIGVLTLPTLVISAVTVARIPTTIDTSTMTAQIDDSTMSQLSSVTASLNTIKTALGVATTHLANNVSMINGPVNDDSVINAYGNSLDPADVGPNSMVCANQQTAAAALLHKNTRYLLWSSGSSAQVVLAKICPAVCGQSSSTTVWYPKGVTFTPPKPHNNAGITLNNGANPISKTATFHKQSSKYKLSVETPSDLSQITMTGTDKYKLKYFAFEVGGTDAVVPNSLEIDYAPEAPKHVYDIAGQVKAAAKKIGNAVVDVEKITTQNSQGLSLSTTAPSSFQDVNMQC